MMFEFMTSDMEKPLPLSYEDLLEMNYTIVTHPSTLVFLEKLINGRPK
jgi:hypothetical protein